MEYTIDFDGDNASNSRVSQEGSGVIQSILHEAVEKNDVELVSLLLRKGADVTAKNSAGLTPLDIANQKLFTDITRLFQRQQDDFLRWCDQGSPEEKDSQGFTKLMKACSQSDEKAVALLLNKGANPNAVAIHNALTRKHSHSFTKHSFYEGF